MVLEDSAVCLSWLLQKQTSNELSLNQHKRTLVRRALGVAQSRAPSTVRCGVAE